MRPAEPQRRCVGCRKPKAQAALFRITMQGGKAQGPGRSEKGRGCYLCRDEKCVRAALKSGQIPRALKGKVVDLSLERLLGWMNLPLA